MTLRRSLTLRGSHPSLGLLLVAVLALVAGAGVEMADFFLPVIPNEAEWAGSGHADATADAFTHWDDEGEVSTSCAKCHSTTGHLDFLGADGTEAGIVDSAAPLGSTVECIACHNEVASREDSVVFPSGIELGDLGPSARCMDCHQGRESKVSVDQSIADANLPDDDTVGGLRFLNIHYYAAAATLLGAEAQGGYQYDGKSYDARLVHADGINKCIDCHDPHTLAVRVDKCATCHQGVLTAEDLHDVRSMGSLEDYDGDGDTAEGVAAEIDGLQAILYQAIQAYATAAGAPIVYDAHAYPYFFADTNANGLVDEGEASYANQYKAWTARLLKAAYNYQVSVKDPGAFAHNGKYVIQLLYDSIEDLNATLVVGLTRDDAGHFQGSAEAFRHWDGDPGISSSCSKCHSAAGLPFLLAEGVSITQPIGNGLTCATCHENFETFARHAVAAVEFPSGASLDGGDPDTNLCMVCHQGRESGLSVRAAVAGLDPDAPNPALRFINVHYLAAGATRFGTEAQGAYEYAGKAYAGLFAHVGNRDGCVDCHDAHNGEVALQACMACHKGIHSPEDIRRDHTDYDADGNVTEGLAGEIETLSETLYAAIQVYAAQRSVPIVYDSHSYPYFFKDANGNGVVDAGEASYGNRYNGFTPKLLAAAYNYQFAQKDPGAFAHNARYVMQVLIDSAEDLGADVSAMARP